MGLGADQSLTCFLFLKSRSLVPRFWTFPFLRDVPSGTASFERRELFFGTRERYLLSLVATGDDGRRGAVFEAGFCG